MAQSFIPFSSPYATDPSSYGLTRVQTPQGLTAYADPSGNYYSPTSNGFQINPSIAAGSLNYGSTTPQAGAQNAATDPNGYPDATLKSPSAAATGAGGISNIASNASNGGGSVSFTYGGKNYSVPGVAGKTANDVAQDYLTSNGIAPASAPATNSQGQAAPATGQGTVGNGTAGGGSTGNTLPSTGDPAMNAALDALEAQIKNLSAVGQIPQGLQITPALTQQFLAWAHQVVDPQTQQTLNQHITALNSNLQQMQADYQNAQGDAIQNFGAQLAGQDNAAGASGTAFSGLHNVQDQNLVNSTNRTLSGLAADAQNQIGQNLNAGAAQVGSQNANQFNLPNLTGATVGLTGGNLSGSQGGSQGGNSLNFNYNPANYTVGTDVSQGNTNVSNQAGNYLGQYTTLAGSSAPTRSVSDLIGGITGLPSNYQVPASLS